VKLRWTPRARRDLFEIGQLIARHSRENARRWVDKLRSRAQDSTRSPLTGRIVPEFEREDIREFIVGNYRIVFRVLVNEIHVLTVFEGHMRLHL